MNLELAAGQRSKKLLNEQPSLQSNFFPAKIHFSKIQKKNLEKFYFANE
jgi:hypothetical protein